MDKKYIDKIITLSNTDDEAIFFSLGIGLQYEFVTDGSSYSANYLELGLDLWKALHFELQEILCTRNGKSKKWINGLIEGDIRELAVGIIGAITTQYNVGMGIAVPATALVVKKGVYLFCKNKVKK